MKNNIKNQKYWEDRIILKDKLLEKDINKIEKKLLKLFKDTRKEVLNELKVIYSDIESTEYAKYRIDSLLASVNIALDNLYNQNEELLTKAFIELRRSTQDRLDGAFITPTLNATPGDLSLVLPKRILDGIVEMIYALDKVAPGTANDDTLLYGVEVKFYNMEVEVNEKLMSKKHDGLYIIGDGSGITHSLSHASASGVLVAREIAK